MSATLRTDDNDSGEGDNRQGDTPVHELLTPRRLVAVMKGEGVVVHAPSDVVAKHECAATVRNGALTNADATGVVVVRLSMLGVGV